jgi:hypothetical protein
MKYVILILMMANVCEAKVVCGNQNFQVCNRARDILSITCNDYKYRANALSSGQQYPQEKEWQDLNAAFPKFFGTSFDTKYCPHNGMEQNISVKGAI